MPYVKSPHELQGQNSLFVLGAHTGLAMSILIIVTEASEASLCQRSLASPLVGPGPAGRPKSLSMPRAKQTIEFRRILKHRHKGPMPMASRPQLSMLLCR